MARRKWTDAEWKVIAHALGCDPAQPDRQFGWRNYFQAGDTHACWPTLLALEAAGDMRRSTTVSGHIVFQVLERARNRAKKRWERECQRGGS